MIIINSFYELKIDNDFDEITILTGDDKRTAFTIKVLNGHSIEVRGGCMVKDQGVRYTQQLQVAPYASNVIKVSKVKYE
jgi:hypothetical protein